MWDTNSVNRLWEETKSDLRRTNPSYHQLLAKNKYTTKVIDKMANYFGLCDDDKKELTVNLHLHRYSSKASIVDTMLHEMAHAIDFCEGGKTVHGPSWKKIAVEVGADPKSSSDIAYKVVFKYVTAIEDGDQLQFCAGHNRKPNNAIVGEIYEVYYTDNRENTEDQIVVYPWKVWVELCDKHNVGYFREDHNNINDFVLRGNE